MQVVYFCHLNLDFSVRNFIAATTSKERNSTEIEFCRTFGRTPIILGKVYHQVK